MSQPEHRPVTRRTGLLLLAWCWVGLPFTYGVYELIRKVVQLFAG